VRVSDPMEKGTNIFGLAAFCDLETDETFYADAVPFQNSVPQIEGFDTLSISTDEPASKAVYEFFRRRVRKKQYRW